MERIDRTIQGATLNLAGKSIRPIARLRGRYQAVGSGKNGGWGAGLRLTPTTVVVEDGDDQYRIPVDDPLQEPLQRMRNAGFAVALSCLLVMWLGRRIARRSRVRRSRVESGTEKQM